MRKIAISNPTLVNGIGISEITIKDVSIQGSKTVAYVNIVLNAAFVLKDLKIINGSKGLFVGFPQKSYEKAGKTVYYDTAHPLLGDLRKTMQSTIVEAYNQAEAQQQQYKPAPAPQSAPQQQLAPQPSQQPANTGWTGKAVEYKQTSSPAPNTPTPTTKVKTSSTWGDKKTVDNQAFGNHKGNTKQAFGGSNVTNERMNTILQGGR